MAGVGVGEAEAEADGLLDFAAAPPAASSDSAGLFFDPPRLDAADEPNALEPAAPPLAAFLSSLLFFSSSYFSPSFSVFTPFILHCCSLSMRRLSLASLTSPCTNCSCSSAEWKRANTRMLFQISRSSLPRFFSFRSSRPRSKMNFLRSRRASSLD